MRNKICRLPVVILCLWAITLSVAHSATRPPSLEGTWCFALQPKLKLSALGAPLRGVLPTLPQTTEPVIFSGDTAFPGTGDFSAAMFTGTWKENNRKFKGNANTDVVREIVQSLLDQGSFLGYTIEGGTFIKDKTTLKGKKLRDGRVKGVFVYTAKWRVSITQPRTFQVPVKAKMVVPFTGEKTASRDACSG